MKKLHKVSHKKKEIATSVPSPMHYMEPKRVSIQQAGNGLIIEQHHGKRNSAVAKTAAEAMKHVKKMLK